MPGTGVAETPSTEVRVMDRRSSVRWLVGFAASALLLSGCAVEALPEDGVSYVREAEDYLVQNERPESRFAARVAEDYDDEVVGPGADDDADEPVEPLSPLTPESDIIEERDETTNPFDGMWAEAPVKKDDPQPEPRISSHRR
jgi:hypothetical protein